MSGLSGEAFPPGTWFGAYRIVRPLGEGASGAIYEAQTSVGKRMALKVLHRSLAGSGDDRTRFEREALATAAIEHPNVVQVFDIGDHEGHLFIAMELLEGETLEQRLEREGPLPVRDVADLFVPLMSALGAVHDRGLVHRDLKPGNIFLVARRPGVVEPKLLDFGVIKDLRGSVGGDMTSTHAMVGSPAYMSPEQAEQSKAIDVRSDQFTVGSIMWECLLGRKLFEGETLYQVLFKIADEPIQSPRSLRPDVPPGLDSLVMRALERDPSRRFPSVRDIGAALLPFCSEHVRAVWRDELLAGAQEPPAEPFDDEVTSMMPSSALGSMAPGMGSGGWGAAPPGPGASLAPPVVSGYASQPAPMNAAPHPSQPPWQPSYPPSAAGPHAPYPPSAPTPPPGPATPAGGAKGLWVVAALAVAGVMVAAALALTR